MNDWFEAEQRVQRALELYESGRLEDALRELRAAIDVNPYQGEWHFNLGLTLDALQRHDEALESFQTALDHHGEHLDILNHLGCACLSLGRPRDAIAYFDRAQKVEPHDDLAYVNRIAAYAALGDHEQAELMFYLAVEIDEDQPDAYFHLAESLIDRQITDRAIWCLHHVRRIDPAHPDVHALLGRAYRIEGNTDRALRHFRHHLRAEPADTAVLMQTGELLIDLGRPVEAAEKFRRVTELDPAAAGAHQRLGELSLRCGDLHRAAASFELVLRLEPMFPGAHQKLARIALRQRDRDEARRHLRRELANRMGDEDLPTTEQLARLLCEAKMPREAAIVLRDCIDRFGSTASLLHQLAVAHFRSGQLEHGIRSARRALRIDRDYITAIHNLIVAHLKLGQLRRARYWSRRAKLIAPQDPRTQQLTAQLRVRTIKATLSKLIGR